jgi:5-methylcytosine-specific restriction endonuclease McrA
MFGYTKCVAKRVYDWDEVQAFHDAKHGFVECQRRFGFCHTAWVKAIKRGELRVAEAPFPDRRRRHDWSEVQAFYDEGHSYRTCVLQFGFSPAAWYKARERAEIVPRRHGMPVAKLLSSPRRNRTHIKGRLLRAGLLQNRCQVCDLTEWRGKPINMHLDHISGMKTDHRLENLRMLCPNCHSQTETYGGRNAKRLRTLQDPTHVV